MTGANATGAQIDTDARETMTGTTGHDRAAEAQVGGENHKHAARVRSIRHTAAPNLLLRHEMGTVRVINHVLIGVTMVGTVAEAQTIWRGAHFDCVSMLLDMLTPW